MLAAGLLLAHLVVPAVAARDARSVARAIEARYRGAHTLKAVFLETYRQGRDGIRAESGTVYFKRPGRMRWDYESPEKKLFLADGKQVWFYVPTDHTASRAPMKQSSDWRTPLALLTGRVQLSKVCGQIELLDPYGNQGAWKNVTEAGDLLLRCVPRTRRESPRKFSAGLSGENEAAGAFREALIEVDPTYQLVRVVIREPGDVETEIRFGDWQENIPLPDVLFRFEPPRGVAIVNEAWLGEWSR